MTSFIHLLNVENLGRAGDCHDTSTCVSAPDVGATPPKNLSEVSEATASAWTGFWVSVF